MARSWFIGKIRFVLQSTFLRWTGRFFFNSFNNIWMASMTQQLRKITLDLLVCICNLFLIDATMQVVSYSSTDQQCTEKWYGLHSRVFRVHNETVTNNTTASLIILLTSHVQPTVIMKDSGRHLSPWIWRDSEIEQFPSDRLRAWLGCVCVYAICKKRKEGATPSNCQSNKCSHWRSS